MASYKDNLHNMSNRKITQKYNINVAIDNMKNDLKNRNISIYEIREELELAINKNVRKVFQEVLLERREKKDKTDNEILEILENTLENFDKRLERSTSQKEIDNAYQKELPSEIEPQVEESEIEEVAVVTQSLTPKLARHAISNELTKLIRDAIVRELKNEDLDEITKKLNIKEAILNELEDAWEKGVPKEKIELCLEGIIENNDKDEMLKYKQDIREAIEESKGISDWVCNYQILSKTQGDKDKVYQEFFISEPKQRNTTAILDKALEISQSLDKKRELPKEEEPVVLQPTKKSLWQRIKDMFKFSRPIKQEQEMKVQVSLAFSKVSQDLEKNSQKVKALKDMTRVAKQIKEQLPDVLGKDAKNVVITVAEDAKDIYYVQVTDKDTNMSKVLEIKKEDKYFDNLKGVSITDQSGKERLFLQKDTTNVFNIISDKNATLPLEQLRFVDTFDSNLSNNRIVEFRRTARALERIENEIMRNEVVDTVGSQEKNPSLMRLEKDIFKGDKYNHAIAEKLAQKAIAVLDVHLKEEIAHNSKSDVAIEINQLRYNILEPKSKKPEPKITKQNDKEMER